MAAAAPDVFRVALPNGVRVDAQAPPLREVMLRVPDAADAAFVLDSAQTALPCERATKLLGRCLGVMDADGDRIARALTIGDREALLLHLRRAALGDAIDCMLQCPSPDCGEAMDLSLRASDLLLAPYDDTRQEHEVVVESAGGPRRIAFRVPNAGDLDLAAALARRDPGRAVVELLRRCILDIEDGSSADTLDAEARAAVAAAMAEHDPQAELQLQLACPSCGTAFSSVFDTAAFLLAELEQRARRLTGEVHLLALNYHWREDDIVAMPAARRARYVELLGARLQ